MEIAPIATRFEPSGGQATACVDTLGSVPRPATLAGAVPLSAAECRAAFPRRMAGRDPLRERLLAMILQNESLRRAQRR